MKLLKVELKRAILSKQMIFSILLGLIVIFIGMLLEPLKSAYDIYMSTAPDLTAGAKENLIGNSLNKVTLWNFGNYYYSYLIPIIACIPFGMEYIKDKKRGYNKYIIIRNNYKSYILSRIVTTFMSGFISIFVITLINLLFINLVDSGEQFRSIFYANNVLSNFSNNNFNFFVILHGLICSLMGGTYALIGLAISSFVDKAFISLIIPFFIYYIGNYIFSILNILPMLPAFVPNFYRTDKISVIYIPIQLLILFTASILIFLKKTYWSEVYE